MKEVDKRFCKKCGELKHRELSGKYSSGKDKRFIDENGKDWHGKTCPTCHQINMKNRMKLSRLESACQE